MATVITQVKDDEYIIEEQDDKKKPPEKPTADGGDDLDKGTATGDDNLEDDKHDDEDDETSDIPLETGSETDEERQAIRERRRKEKIDRRNYRKEKDEQTRRELSALRKEREDLANRLAILERKTTGSEMAQIDTAIEEADRYAQALKQQIQVATEANDGAAMADATAQFYQVQQRGTELKRLKQAAIQNQQRSVQQQPATAPDPSLKRNAEAWMSKNAWYNPQGLDLDSRVALTIDQNLAEEGYDPRTQEFWDELSARVNKYLPHRAPKAERQTRQPPATTSGSGRDPGGANRNAFKLSPERVQAMKDAGIWEDVEARNKMIKTYSDYDKQNKQ